MELVVKRLFFSPLEPFLREMLIYSDISYMVKKEIITQRLLRGDKEIFYSISDLIQSKKTKYARCYKDLSPLFREVYCRTLGVLYFSEFDYQRKLGTRVAEMYRRSQQEGYAALNDPRLLTATLLHMVERTQYPVFTLLHIFNIEDDQLMLYIAAFTK